MMNNGFEEKLYGTQTPKADEYDSPIIDCDDAVGVAEEAHTPTPCEENVPKERFATTLYKVYKNETLTEALRVLSYAIVLGVLYAFAYQLVGFIGASYMQAVRLAVVCGVPFVIVSLMRRIINMPRPYEVYDFYDKPPKNKCGRSFPSRHVFSAFVIGTSICFYNLFVGMLLCSLGVILCICRVLLGIHFIKDTVAGALIGIAGGVIGMLISGLFF
jgi:membrane-associated phospholipid phosphatase